jgi:SIR2-like domain
MMFCLEESCNISYMASQPGPAASEVPVRAIGVLPPYGTILDEIRAGMVIPFLGAAASRVGMQPGESKYLPSGRDLAELLAADAEFPSSDTRERGDLAKVSSYYVDGSNRGALRRKLRRVFVNDAYECNELHRLLAELANNLFIVTTNYDTLLEKAFQDQKKPYDLLIYPADNDEYANAVLWWPHGAREPEKVKPNQFELEGFGSTNVIYKMHGSVRADVDKWDSFVITEEDYVKFLARMRHAVPSSIRKYFAERAFLFLGYGLNDWNMRVLLKEVSVPGITSWAILKNPTPFERKLWERRSVDIFDLSLELQSAGGFTLVSQAERPAVPILT